MRRTPPATLVTAGTLFFISGALGLGYQLVWIRKAALVVGSSQIALATVLTSFFLGLGLGSLFVGRHLRGRRRSPLFVYGLFEAAIGVYALAFPGLFEGMESLYGALYPLVASSPVSLFGVRFAAMFLLFLPPTFFMGGTLPLLLDGLVAEDETVGSRTSWLYGLNILGAVAGVLVTGYYAIPAAGMNGTSRICGAGNLAVAAVALAAFRHAPPGRAARRPETPAGIPFVLLAFASGLVSIGYQIAWARYFGLFNVASVYRTAVLLATFLAALAVGSLALAPLLTRRIAPLRILALAQAAIPVLVVLLLPVWRWADYRFAPYGATERGEMVASWTWLGETWDAIFVAPLLQTGLVIFLPVVLLGTGLPCLIAAATRAGDELRGKAGELVFWNTIGSSAGGFLTGYVLIPTAGLTGTFLTLGGVSALIAAIAEWRHGYWTARADRAGAGPARLLRRPGYVLGAAALALAGWWLRDDVTRRAIVDYGLGAEIDGARLTDVVEGPLTTAFVLETDSSRYIGAGDVILAEVPYHAASTQAVQGHIPALFFPRPGTPRDCLGIALGSGQSFGALLTYPIERLDVVDISREMIDLSLEYFAEYNHGLGSDPRVTLHVDDGRHFVDRAAAFSYDVVSMEPPPPTAEGVFSLYSVEFYRGVERILRDGGVLVQWLPLYMVTPRDLRGLLATQAAVFPNTFVVRAGAWDFVIVSFKGAEPRFDVRQIALRAETFARERLIAQSRWQGGNYLAASPMGIVSMLVTGPGDIANLESPSVFEDDTQRLSYSSGDREILRRYRDDRERVARLSFAALPRTTFADLQRYFAEPIPVEELDAERAAALAHFRVPPPAAVRVARRRFEEAAQGDVRTLWAARLAQLFDRPLAKDEALRWIERAIEARPDAVPDEALEIARGIARNQAATYGARIAAWAAGLPPEARRSALVVAMLDEL